METKARIRIYTEDRPGYGRSVEFLVAKYTNGATITQAKGLWMGRTESSLVIEILCGEWEAVNLARSLCADLRWLLCQDAVLFTIDSVEAELVVETKNTNASVRQEIDWSSDDEAIHDVLISKIEELINHTSFFEIRDALADACLRVQADTEKHRGFWLRVSKAVRGIK